MWEAMVGIVIFIYIGIFSLLKTSSRGEEISKKHREDLLDTKDEIFIEENNDEKKSEENERKRHIIDPQ